MTTACHHRSLDLSITVNEIYKNLHAEQEAKGIALLVPPQLFHILVAAHGSIYYSAETLLHVV